MSSTGSGSGSVSTSPRTGSCTTCSSMKPSTGPRSPRSVRVQASGGLRTDDDVAAALDAGAARAVLGSAALADREAAAALIERYGERLAVGLEVEGGTVRPRGRVDARWPLAEVLSWL